MLMRLKQDMLNIQDTATQLSTQILLNITPEAETNRAGCKKPGGEIPGWGKD